MNDNIVNQGIQTLPRTVPENRGQLIRNILFADDVPANGVINIMVNIGNFIGKLHDTPLQRVRMP